MSVSTKIKKPNSYTPDEEAASLVCCHKDSMSLFICEKVKLRLLRICATCGYKIFTFTIFEWITVPVEFSDSRYSKEALNSRSEEHTSELQSRENLVCRLLL